MPKNSETNKPTSTKLGKIESMVDTLMYEDSEWREMNLKVTQSGDCINITPAKAKNARISVHVNVNREWIDLTVTPGYNGYDHVEDRLTRLIPIIQGDTKRMVGLGRVDNFMKCLSVSMLKKDDAEDYCKVIEELFKYVGMFRS